MYDHTYYTWLQWLYNKILENSVLQTVWQQLGKHLYLFQNDNAPVHKARSIKKCFSKFGVEELDWPALSRDLNAIQHLWEDLECWLWTRPYRPTSMPDITHTLVAKLEETAAARVQNINIKAAYSIHPLQAVHPAAVWQELYERQLLSSCCKTS